MRSMQKGSLQMTSDKFLACDRCSDEHPIGALEDGLCPCCVDSPNVEIMTGPSEFPGGAPDQETFDLMNRLSDLQTWCAMMARKDSGGIPAAQLIQDTRAFIVERLYPGTIAAKAAREEKLRNDPRREHSGNA